MFLQTFEKRLSICSDTMDSHSNVDVLESMYLSVAEESRRVFLLAAATAIKVRTCAFVVACFVKP